MNIEFQLAATYLSELQFKNKPVASSEGEIRYDLNIDVKYELHKQAIIVVLEVTATSEIDPDKDQFECKAVQVGVFNFKQSETGQFVENIDYNQFANINAAAILFPFVRQIIASVTGNSKSGIALLPLVNFVARWEAIKNEIQ